MAIHKTTTAPVNAHIGDAWTDGKSFKRVLSRGGAWENVNLGAKHPDEVDHEQQQAARAEAGRDAGEVPLGSGESAPGDGNNGEALSEPGLGRGQENTGVDEPAGHESNDDVSSTGEPLTSTGPIEDAADEGVEGEGIDGNGSPVV